MHSGRKSRAFRVTVCAIVTLLIVYHSISQYQYHQVKRKARSLELALKQYPSLKTNITVRAIPNKGAILVEGKVLKESDRRLIESTIRAARISAGINVDVLEK